MIPWMLLPAHARRTRLRTLLTVGSVAIAVFLFCALRTIITTIDRTVTSAASSRIMVHSAVSLFVALPRSVYDRCARLPGVRAATHWTWFGGVYLDERNFFARFAVEVPTMRQVYGDRRPRGPDLRLSPAAWEAFERERTACIVGKGLAERYGFRVGDKVPLQGDIYPGDYQVVVRGIYESLVPSFDEQSLFFHWDYLNEKSGGRNVVGVIGLDIEDPSRGPQVIAAAEAEYANSAWRVRALTEQAFQAQFIAMWGNLPLFLSMIGGAILFSACMVTLNTLLLNARERVTEVGVLKTLGFPGRSIASLHVVEAVVLCGLGGLLGCGLAVGLLNGGPVQARLSVFFPGFLVLPETASAAMGIALGLGLLAGAVPGLLAARLPLARALRRVG